MLSFFSSVGKSSSSFSLQIVELLYLNLGIGIGNGLLPSVSKQRLFSPSVLIALLFWVILGLILAATRMCVR